MKENKNDSNIIIDSVKEKSNFSEKFKFEITTKINKMLNPYKILMISLSFYLILFLINWVFISFKLIELKNNNFEKWVIIPIIIIILLIIFLYRFLIYQNIFICLLFYFMLIFLSIFCFLIIENYFYKKINLFLRNSVITILFNIFKIFKYKENFCKNKNIYIINSFLIYLLFIINILEEKDLNLFFINTKLFYILFLFLYIDFKIKDYLENNFIYPNELFKIFGGWAIDWFFDIKFLFKKFF